VPNQLFAIERYDDTGGHAAPPDPFPKLPAHVHLAGAYYLPADEVVIAFVRGADTETVRDAVTGAGWRVDRISPAGRIRQGEGVR